jgi:CheY-like chemotaxis protein
MRRFVEALYNAVRNWRRHPTDTLVQDLQFRNIAGPLVEALSDGPWEALVVVQSNCARWLDYVPRPRLSVLVMHDVRALVYERRVGAAGSLIERLACWLEARRYRRFERTYCRRFDVVVTDYKMKGIDGKEVDKKIGRNRNEGVAHHLGRGCGKFGWQVQGSVCFVGANE